MSTASKSKKKVTGPDRYESAQLKAARDDMATMNQIIELFVKLRWSAQRYVLGRLNGEVEDNASKVGPA